MLPSFPQIGTSLLPKRWVFMNPEEDGYYSGDDMERSRQMPSRIIGSSIPDNTRRTVRRDVVDKMALEAGWTPNNYAWFRKKSVGFLEMYEGERDEKELIQQRADCVSILLKMSGQPLPDLKLKELPDLRRREEDQVTGHYLGLEWYEYYANMMAKLVLDAILVERGVKIQPERAFAGEEAMRKVFSDDLRRQLQEGRREPRISQQASERTEQKPPPSAPAGGQPLPNAQPGDRRTGRVGRTSGVYPVLTAGGKLGENDSTPGKGNADPRKTLSGRQAALGSGVEQVAGSSGRTPDPRKTSSGRQTSLGGVESEAGQSTSTSDPRRNSSGHNPGAGQSPGNPEGNADPAKGASGRLGRASSGTYQALGDREAGSTGTVPASSTPRQRPPAPPLPKENDDLMNQLWGGPPAPTAPSAIDFQAWEQRLRAQEAEIAGIAKDTRERQLTLLSDQGQLQTDRKAYERESADLARYRSDLERWIAGEQKTIAADRKTNADEAAELKRRRTELEERIKSEQHRIGSERAALAIERRAAEALKAQAHTDAARMQEKRDIQTRELTIGETQLETLRGTIRTLEERKKKLEGEVRDAEKRLADLQGQIRSLKAEKDKLERAVSPLKSEVQGLEQRKSQLLVDQVSLQRAIDPLQIEKARLEAMLPDLRRERDELTGAVKQAREELSSERTALEQARATLVETQGQQLIDIELQDRRAALAAEITRLETRCDAVCRGIAEAEARAQEMTREAQALVSDAPMLGTSQPQTTGESSATPELTSAIQALGQRITAMKAEREQVQRDLEERKAEREALQSELIRLEEEQGKMTDSLHQTRASTTLFELRSQELQAQHLETETVLARTRTTIEQLLALSQDPAQQTSRDAPVLPYSSENWKKLLKLKERRGHFQGQQIAIEARLAELRGSTDEQAPADIASLEQTLQALVQRLPSVEASIVDAEAERTEQLSSLGNFATVVQGIMISQELLLENLWKDLGIERTKQQLLEFERQRDQEQIAALKTQLEQQGENPLVDLISRFQE